MDLKKTMEFPHKAPEGFKYETDDYSKTMIRIWIRNCTREFIGTSEVHPRSVWGFFCRKKGQFIAPVNKNKPGKVVKAEDTTPYSAMQLNLNPLMYAFYQ